MANRLGTNADVLLTESILGKILETMDSMLLESDAAGIILTGDSSDDAQGRFMVIRGIGGEPAIGLCVASNEGGTEPSDNDLRMFKSKMQSGILMKVDVYAHQFSMYKVSDTVDDATVLFQE